MMTYETQEIFVFAEKIIEESRSLYDRALENVESEDVKKILEELADDESKNKAKLVNASQKLGPRQNKIKAEKGIDEDELEALISITEISPDSNDREVLSIVLGRKRNTENLFRLVRSFEDLSDDAGELFDYLVQQEQNQVKKLNNVIVNVQE